MDTEFFQACREWATAEDTRRFVEIKIDGLYTENSKAWVYDYDFQYGVHITEIDELPSAEEMEARVRAKLAADLEALSR